jgi:hypothetical protein
LPPRWAIFGSLLTALHPSILIRWSQSYWGGTVAMVGGALVFGAMRRIMRRPSLHDAVLLGVGLGVLANSRPYEGLVVSLPVAVVLLVWMFGKNGPAAQVSLKRIVLPISIVFVCTAIAMGFYNLNVTGNALRMPYMVHDETYAMAPFLLWQQPRPELTYHHDIIRYHHIDELAQYMKQRSLRGFMSASVGRFRSLWRFYQGDHGLRLRFLLGVPLLMLPWLMRDRWLRIALLICGILMVGLLLETWMFPHYAAPIIGLVCVLVLQAMRYLRLWRWHSWPTGSFMVWTICIIAVTSFTVEFAQQIQKKSSGWSSDRAHILARLNKDERRHLVIVRYGPLNSIYHKWWQREWVYNEADIDDAKVVWAREMDDMAQNRKLLKYFKDREVWLLEIERQDSHPKLVPYGVKSPRDIGIAIGKTPHS